MLVQHLCQHLSIWWPTTLILLGLLLDLRPQCSGNFQQCYSLVCRLLLSLIVVDLQPAMPRGSMLAGLKVGEARWLDWLRLTGSAAGCRTPDRVSRHVLATVAPAPRQGRQRAPSCAQASCLTRRRRKGLDAPGDVLDP